MTHTTHGTVLQQGDIEIRNGYLRINLWGDVQEFNIEPAVMVDVGFQMVAEGHKRIMAEIDRKDRIIEGLYDHLSEYETVEGEQ